MNLKRYGGLTLLATACAAGSYFATYALQRTNAVGSHDAPRAAGPSVSDWLRLEPQQAADVRNIEADFAADRAPLERQLAAEREQLASMLEDPATTGAEILQQVDKVIAAQNALERRVADLLVAMRPHLRAQQQQRLFERFASGVREGCGGRWRHGQRGDFEDGRHGGGPPSGRGPGRGYGRGAGFEGRGRHQSSTTPTTQSQGVQP
jgi:hypothetical protein